MMEKPDKPRPPPGVAVNNQGLVASMLFGHKGGNSLGLENSGD